MRGVIRGDRYYLDGREVTKAEFDAALPDRPLDGGNFGGLTGASTRPKESISLGVHPRQAAEAEALAKARGVPTEFNRENGRPVFTSRAHQKAYCKTHGFRNNDGGYGD
jgi:hypothetical protein